jgi:hypothetical protein
MQSLPLHGDLLQTQMENFDQDSSLISSSGGISVANSYPVIFLFFLKFHWFPKLGLFFFCLPIFVF